MYPLLQLLIQLMIQRKKNQRSWQRSDNSTVHWPIDWHKVAMTDWLKNILTHHLVDESTDLHEEDRDRVPEQILGERDFEYELADVV